MTSQSPTAERAPRNLPAMALALVAAVLLAFWVWHLGAERRAVWHLPAGERAEIYRRELADFQTFCGPTPRADALEQQCRERAEFILQFPECDGTCQRLTSGHRLVAKPR